MDHLPCPGSCTGQGPKSQSSRLRVRCAQNLSNTPCFQSCTVWSRTGLAGNQTPENLQEAIPENSSRYGIVRTWPGWLRPLAGLFEARAGSWRMGGQRAFGRRGRLQATPETWVLCSGWFASSGTSCNQVGMIIIARYIKFLISRSIRCFCRWVFWTASRGLTTPRRCNPRNLCLGLR